ncbi:hypothetical protein PV326_006871 [Microctonus aethiopoides]|nr:hypothetical protein PV326_006871 [Microctonus aethiopoides]
MQELMQFLSIYFIVAVRVSTGTKRVVKVKEPEERRRDEGINWQSGQLTRIKRKIKRQKTFKKKITRQGRRETIRAYLPSSSEKMGWPSVALLGLTTLTLVTSYHLTVNQLLPPTQKHIPPSNFLTFQRTSVEGIPKRYDFIDDDNNEEIFEFGSISLPLRDAVESSPNKIDNQFEALHNAVEFQSDYGRTPLRDAVEQRPPPPLGNNIVSHDSIWLEQLSPAIIRRSQGPTKILCHFDATAVHRTEPFSLYPDGIPSRMCTHIIYNALTIDLKTFSVIPIDSNDHKANGSVIYDYKSIIGLRKKNPSLRILISIIFPKDDKFYRELFNENDNYKQLCELILEFINKNKFDGVELNWDSAPINQLKLILKSLYTQFITRDKILAVTLKSHDNIDPEITKISHILLLQSWKNIHKKYATSPAPLRMTLNFVKRWLNSGVNSNKLILDIPLFGNSYTLKFRNESQSGSPVNGPGISGLYTKIQGTLAYYEICDKMEEIWEYNRDRDSAYLQRGDQWIGYDDPISIKIKAAYIRSMGLGGISLSTLDYDDFIGICGESWPMLTVANNALGIFDTAIGKCHQDGVFHDPENCSGFLICDKLKLYRGTCDNGYYFDRKNIQCVKSHSGICDAETIERFSDLSVNYLSTLREKQHRQKLHLQHSGPRVVCYMTSWALYRKGDGKFVPEHLDTRLCTDIIYAFAGLNPDTLTLQPFDSWADIDNGLYQRVTSMKGTRVLLGLGGWTDSAGDKYSRLVSSPSGRKNFITNAINFLHSNNFNGISIEWNYPKCWQSNCKKGLDSDRPNFTKFIKELREAFDKESPNLIITVSLSGYKEVIDRAYDIRELSNAADFLTVMTYDYHGAWESRTGHLAPLYSTPNDINPFYNMNWTMNYLTSLGAEKKKLVAGIPFYGQAYRLTQPDRSRLGDPAAGPGNPGEFTGQPGMLAYYEICERIKQRKWKTGDGPSAYFKNQFVGYDDINSIAIKGKWILQNGFGGATAWTVDLDDFNNKCCFEPFPLLRSLNRALGRLLDPLPISGNCERPSDPVTPQAPIMTTHSDANDGGPRPTRPMTSTPNSITFTTKATTWPTWTENSSKNPMTITTSWPTWSWSSTSPSTTVTTTTTIR